MTMGMGMDHGQHMDMRPSPSLIQFTEILALTGLELQDLIVQTVAENPALEVAENELCPACGDPLLEDGTCFRCQRGEDLAGDAERSLVEPDEEEFDRLTRIADQYSLAEYLLTELSAVLDERDMPVAEYLVGELDERGFMAMPLDMAAGALGVPAGRVERALLALQSVGPLGLGARSVEECLLLQLARWEEAGAAHPLARPLIAHHLEALGHGKYGEIARALDVAYDEVIAARDFIRGHLRPYPIAETVDLHPWDRQEGPGFIAPDVIIRHDERAGLSIEIVESRRWSLSISPMYGQLASDLDTEPASGMSTSEEEHVRKQVQRAYQFLSHVHERRQTLRRVMAYVVERQVGFLLHGPRRIVPLTRAEVAESLALHESTVSRAVAGKYALLPSRQVISCATFFKAALSVHDVLREIIDGETRPLTDGELADELTRRGFKVARRTVAKYRNEMKILPSSLR